MSVPSAVREGNEIGRGKTKSVIGVEGDPTRVVLRSLDSVTAGDGARRIELEGKGVLATKATCDIFELLKKCGVPVAYERRIDPDRFLAPACKMIPLEVVARRSVPRSSSYRKRHPHVPAGYVFRKLVVEFFLKTTGRKWGDHELPCDDPYARIDSTRTQFNLYDPHEPLDGRKPFLTIPIGEAIDPCYIIGVERITRLVFLTLEKAWQNLRHRLEDFKIEFGITPDGRLVVADVIDADSCKVVDEQGNIVSKQKFRDGAPPEEVLEMYKRFAELTGMFLLPRQRLIIWSGSPNDDVSPFKEAFNDVVPELQRSLCGLEFVVLSGHKAPEEALFRLAELVYEVPDSVVIAYVGLSNGLGPMLSAAGVTPVISVPATFREFPLDVFSSLRMPSAVPTATIVSPTNAVLFALQSFAQRHPFIYAQLRLTVEKRLLNVVILQDPLRD